MKDVHAVLRQTEAVAGKVRQEIESLKFVSSFLSDELSLKGPFELLRQKEADITRVRQEIAYLKIVAPLLSEELVSYEVTKTPADSAEQEARHNDDISKATGTDNLFSSNVANPRRTFWELLKRKT
jgi:hypothetical protein